MAFGFSTKNDGSSYNKVIDELIKPSVEHETEFFRILTVGPMADIQDLSPADAALIPDLVHMVSAIRERKNKLEQSAMKYLLAMSHDGFQLRFLKNATGTGVATADEMWKHLREQCTKQDPSNQKLLQSKMESAFIPLNNTKETRKALAYLFDKLVSAGKTSFD